MVPALGGMPVAASGGPSASVATWSTEMAATMMALLSAVVGQGAHSISMISGESLSFGHALPVVLKLLFENIQRWEFVDLVELLPLTTRWFLRSDPLCACSNKQSSKMLLQESFEVGWVVGSLSEV